MAAKYKVYFSYFSIAGKFIGIGNEELELSLDNFKYAHMQSKILGLYHSGGQGSLDGIPDNFDGYVTWAMMLDKALVQGLVLPPKGVPNIIPMKRPDDDLDKQMKEKFPSPK